VAPRLALRAYNAQKRAMPTLTAVPRAPSPRDNSLDSKPAKKLVEGGSCASFCAVLLSIDSYLTI
jgi:hypothetical protein